MAGLVGRRKREQSRHYAAAAVILAKKHRHRIAGVVVPVTAIIRVFLATSTCASRDVHSNDDTLLPLTSPAATSNGSTWRLPGES